MLLSPSCAFGGMAVASGSAVNGAGVLGGRDGQRGAGPTSRSARRREAQVFTSL